MLRYRNATVNSTGNDKFAAAETYTMEEDFRIPVSHNGKEHLFAASLQQTGYTYRILVDVEGVQVLFEPDEEKNFRALLDPDAQSDAMDISLIRAIADALETIIKWYFDYGCVLIGYHVKVTFRKEKDVANTRHRQKKLSL